MNRALEVQRLLAKHRGNGHRRPIPDLIIAATAELHGAEVTGQLVRRLFDPGRVSRSAGEFFVSGLCRSRAL
jgi:hypothetical protein